MVVGKSSDCPCKVEIEVSVGLSLSGVTLTETVISVADNKELSKAFIINAAVIPLMFFIGSPD
jgi:hypothetical protein